MTSIQLSDDLRLDPAVAGDFDTLAEIRIEAMRANLERAGRFDPARARERLRASFFPEHTRHIVFRDERIGFNITRPVDDGLLLDHTYIRPRHHHLRVGLAVVQWATALADAQDAALYTVRLKGSADGFLRRLGFVKTHEDDLDSYYTRAPHGVQRARHVVGEGGMR